MMAIAQVGDFGDNTLPGANGQDNVIFGDTDGQLSGQMSTGGHDTLIGGRGGTNTLVGDAGSMVSPVTGGMTPSWGELAPPTRLSVMRSAQRVPFPPAGMIVSLALRTQPITCGATSRMLTEVLRPSETTPSCSVQETATMSSPIFIGSRT